MSFWIVHYFGYWYADGICTRAPYSKWNWTWELWSCSILINTQNRFGHVKHFSIHFGIDTEWTCFRDSSSEVANFEIVITLSKWNITFLWIWSAFPSKLSLFQKRFVSTMLKVRFWKFYKWTWIVTSQST